jgi:hypothetical protein
VLRRLRVFLVSMLSVVSIPAVVAAQGATDAPESDEPTSVTPKPSEPPSSRGSAEGASVTLPEAATEAVTTPAPSEAEPKAPVNDWHTEVHGYFRAPMSLGISSRPNPDTPDGPPKGQISYGPNRTVDASYYSFAYTRLQEQDWAELTFHVKKKHADAAVGWMGYWLSATGFRNPDAAAVPGVASLTLDTDFDLAGRKPNIAFQMGAWWPGFGYFEKYDIFILGRFRQIGEQLKLMVPVNPDLKVEIVEGFGTGRDGAFSYNVAASSPLYASKVGADLLAYANVRLQYKKYVDVGLHFNTEWTRDPYLTADADPKLGKAYSDAARARLSVVGAEANLSAPYAGRLWISPSHISVKSGWALGNNGGTEVMHAQGGLGIATNYLAWSGAPLDSTGTGSMFNFGFLYENTLSNVQGKAPASAPHDVRLNIFGLMTSASLDLPAGTQLKQTSIKQFKYGADVSVQALDWLNVMLRGDTVNYDLNNPGLIFSAITTRLTVSTHYLSSESIYLQYSRYVYGDKMLLAGQWPWGTPLVAGSDVIQGGTYSGKKPDQDVVKLQATIAF